MAGDCQLLKGPSLRAAVSLIALGVLSVFAVHVGADPLSSVQVAPEPERPRMPEAARGAWRAQVQLVWNAASSRLDRRRYELFDPFADARFDIFWEAHDIQTDQPGRIAGTGVLTWRRAGALRYGSASIMAQYRGEMVDGRPQGRGTYIDRSGLRYDGEWATGLMEGEGHLLLPNGDVYRGGFKAGRLQGHGVYIDAAGRLYDGGFSAGLRDGPAHVVEPNGLTYASFWSSGIEDQQRRTAASEEWAKLYRVEARRGLEGVAVTVGLDARP